jgi:hypothetical protein
MGQGTTRVAETNGGAGRVRELGGEITEVRHRLDSLVVELDRRRHNATNWKHHLRRHAGSLAIGAVAFTAALAAPLVLARRRARRRRILGIPAAALGQRALRLADALARVRRPPDPREAPAALGVGKSTVVGLLVMIAQVVVTTWMRSILDRPRA